jgi:two-component system, OmpR family, response regulator VicR
MKVLVVDDDEEIINIVKLTFRVGWPEAEVTAERLGQRGLERTESEAFHLIVLDLGLPDISGFEVLKKIRLFSDTPVVILTASSDEVNIVRGLEMGATDYVVKPFRQMEFLARLKAASRNLHRLEPEDLHYKIGSYRFFPSSRKIETNNKKIILTATESNLLLHLARNKGKPVTYNSIALKLWEHDYPGACESIRVYIKNLRLKLEPEPSNPVYILTAPGIGYYLATDQA